MWSAKSFCWLEIHKRRRPRTDLSSPYCASRKAEACGPLRRDAHHVRRANSPANHCPTACRIASSTTRVLHPSGGNRQAVRIIVVRDQQTRDRLAELSVLGAQRYVAQQIGRASC